jgi:hypothetical protein
MKSKTQALIATLTLLVCTLVAPRGFADDVSPFKHLPGRWVGEGRIRLEDGKVDSVKCRATYFVSADANELTQNIRCASPSGKIEVKGSLTHEAGQLSGSWHELIYNLGGDLRGAVTPLGLRITVRGADLTAYMDLVVMEDKQVVEIQFFNSTLSGLTLMLEKG